MGNAKKFKILIIEDDERLLETLCLSVTGLSDLNIETIQAVDGKEGLKMCETHQFDAVITDYSMPEMDGMQFIKEFRSKSKNKSIPIIFTSGFFYQLDFKKNMNMFENVIFIDKPFEFSKVNSFLKLYLK